jgi:predicted transcriptional regulator
MQSAESNVVTVNTAVNSNLSVPTIAVSLSNGQRNIVVSNVNPNATINLYTSNGYVYATSIANSSGTATSYNVASGSYYATQTWSGSQSAASGDAMLS